MMNGDPACSGAANKERRLFRNKLTQINDCGGKLWSSRLSAEFPPLDI
jgi:hypothetical protein